MDKNYISFIGRIAAFFSGGKASGKRAGAALFTLASALGLWLFVAAHFRADAITEAGRSLATINSYKAAQISSWLGYHEREALRLSRHPFLGELVMQELAGPGSRRAQLTSWLIDHARQKRYSSMAFLSPKGAVIVTSPGHPAVGGKEFTAGFEQAVQKKRGLVTDLYLAAAGKPRLTIFSPIFQNGDGKKPVCVLAINIDPGAEFYPLVKAAPLFFVNAETLLVRKEGDSVLFLNELEYAKDAALRLKRPLSDKKLPAAAALAGQTGFFEGVDYRGVEVFSAIGPVKGTAWAVVTKIDRAALLAPVRRTQYLWLAVLLLAAGLLHAGLLAVFAAKRRAAEALLAHSRNLLAETERLGKVGGWELDLATGKNIWTDEVYRIHEVDPSYDPNVEKAINFYAPSSRPAIERAVRRAIERGDGFDLELEIITAKGNVRAVHAIGRADLKAQRLYGFFQDITERKRAEEQLHESESKYSRLYQQMMDSFVRVDMDGRILEFNEAYCRLTGYTPEELKNLTYQDLTPAAWHEAERAILQDKIIARGYSGLYEKEYRRKDGSLVPVELSTTLERDAGGKPRAMCGVIRDISERKRAEEKLRVEQERFRQAAEAAQFGVYSYDHETGESSYSDEFMWLYGLPAGATLELDADLAPKALHPADKAGFLTAMKAGNDPAGSGVFEHEFRIILPDSRARWLRVRGRTFFSGTGAGARPLRASGIIQDVSERKEIAEILRESEARLRSLWLHMDEGVALHELVRGSSGEPENYRIIEVNPRYGTILGILPDEIKNQLATEAYKTPVPPYLKEYSAVVASGKPAYLETYFPPMDKHFSISIAPWGRDGFATIFSDITDKKRADEALLKSTRSLSDAQKLAHLGYWDWDVRTGAVKWSEEVYKIFGLDPKVFTPKIDSILELSPWPEDHARDKELIKKAAETRESGTYDQRFLRPDRSTGYYHSTFQGKYDPAGGLVSIFGTILDITERKLTELELDRLNRALLEKNKEMENFLYITTHDLRSPLVNIQGFSQNLERYAKELSTLLTRTALPPETKEELEKLSGDRIPGALKFVLESSRKMDGLITALLKVSRIGRVEMKPETVEMNGLIKRILASLRFQLETTGGEVRCGELPPCTADQAAVSQLFSNLLDNAVKYRQAGRALVVTVSGEVKGGMVLYTVADNGSGIEEPELHRIWNVFYQADRRPGRKGEGIGLPMVRRITEKNGGGIRAESKYGEGTTFYLELPAAEEKKNGKQQ